MQKEKGQVANRKDSKRFPSDIALHLCVRVSLTLDAFVASTSRYAHR